MNTDLEKRFLLGASCYFDMDSSTIVDLLDGQPARYTAVSTTESTVLRLLIHAYPDAVSKEQLCAVINADCDNSDVRRIINKLKNRHPQLKLWIPRGREGEYRLREPAGAKRECAADCRPEAEPPCVLKSTGICPRPNFVSNARLDIFSALDTAFQAHPVVFLQGIGGIGKTETAKHWAMQKKGEGLFDTVVFAQLNSESGGNVQSLVTDDTIFVISAPFCHRDERESLESYFYRKLAKIKQVTDERTLIVIDNYDIDDPLLATLFTGPYRLLVTTRNRQVGYDFPLIPVTEIRDPVYLKEIFFKNLGDERNDIDRDDPYLEKLFALVSNHTLTIEIIAKSLVNSVDMPQVLYQKISDPERHTLLHGMDGLVERNFSEEPLNPFVCIRRLFNLSRLEGDRDFEDKSQVLAFLAAMPTRGVELSLFRKWSSSRIIQAKNSLVRKSWLRQHSTSDGTLISMHPLIREIVWHELKPSPEKCRTLIELLSLDDAAYLDGLYHQPKHIKDQYERIAASLLTAFPVRDLSEFEFHIRIQRIFHICANFDTALSILNDLKTKMEQSGLVSSFQYGFLHFRIASAYLSIRKPLAEVEMYCKAAERLMTAAAHTDKERMWLAFLYREMANIRCQSPFLFRPHGPEYAQKAEEWLSKGLALAEDLQSRGFRNTNLALYYGTVCVWRSKLAIYRDDLDQAADLIDTAEAEFIRLGYVNAIDKTAVEDIRARIYSAQGAYDREIDSIKKAMKVFVDGFGEYHHASIERAIRLAAAYQNNHQPKEAVKILTHYQKIAEEMLGCDAALTHTIRSRLAEILENMVSRPV